MRLNKKWMTYGVILGIVAVLTTLGIVQAQQMGKKSDLSEELDTAEQVLSMLETKQFTFWQDESGTQLDEAQANYNNAMTQLTQPLDSIIAQESLFDIAELSSVTLMSITVSPLSDEILAELPCSIMDLNLDAEGNITALLDFVSRLNTDLDNGLVRSAIIHIPETQADGESSVDIELVIYTYQGGE